MSILSEKIEDNIPNGWNVYKASDLFENYSEKGLPYEKQLMVTQNRGTIYREDGDIDIKVSEESLKSYKLVNKGDFIISLRSFQGGIEYSGLRGIVSPAYTILRNKKEINHNYYKYLFKSSLFIDMLNSAVIGIRDGKQISFQVFKEFPLYYPPLKEQEKIASILSTVDEQIDNVEELIEKNKELKKGLMQQLLTKGIGHTKFKKTDIGEVPEEWEVEMLGKVVEFSQGIQISLEEQYEEYKEGYERFLRIIDYTQKSKEYRYIKYPGERYLVKKDDVVMVRYGATAGFVGTGLEGIIANNIFKINPNNEILLKEYMYIYLNQESIFKTLNMSTGASAMPAINFGMVSKLNIIIPSIEEQKKISSILAEVDEKIEGYENKKQNLEELKKGLMQQLLTGRIRIT